MADVLTSYKENKERVFNLYNKILEKNILPVRTPEKFYDISFINKQIKNLENEKFYVSICGQIKTGKSTVVNAILFEDIVLPLGHTPTTATLSIIKYGDKPKVLAHFYSKSDWERIKLSPRYEKDIKPEVDIALENGVNIESVIKENGMSKEYELNELSELVKVKGKYSPFIKEVEIYYPSDILKDLIVVDTPGTNDPNVVRTERTLKWVKESNAVIYLFYAGKALSIDDVEFINKYLTHIPKDYIILAVNKIDAVEADSISALKNYLEINLKNDKRLKNLKLLEGKELYFISSIAALITSLKNKGKKLGNDFMFYDSKLPKEMLENAGNIDELKNAIAHHLLKYKGKSIIETHLYTIRDIVQQKITLEKEALRKEEQTCKSALKDQRQREDELKGFKNIFINIRKNEKKLDSELKDSYNSFERKLNRNIRSGKKAITQSLATFINGKDIDEIRIALSYRAKCEIEEHMEDLLDNSYKKAMQALQHDIEHAFIDFKNTAGDRFDLQNEIDLIYQTFSITELMQKIDLRDLSRENLKMHTKKFLFFITLKKKTKEEYKGLVYETVEEAFDSICNNILGTIKMEIDKNSRIIVGKIKEYLQTLHQTIKEVNDKIKSGKMNIKKIEEDIESRKSLIKKLEEWKNKEIIEIINNIQP